MSLDRISVIGLGYIGLPTAAVIASRKRKVIGVDVNKEVVETINRGDVHIVEPELDLVVRSVVKEGYLEARLEPAPADAFLIAVPTPFKDSHEPDLSYIENACAAIAPVLKKGDLVVLESTSPVGTTEKIANWLAKSRSDLSFPQTHGGDSDIRIAHCPERVLPGQVIRELVENDRVIGGMTEKCSNRAAELYEIFVDGECIFTTVRAAEMAKLTENSFRDVNIAFANELSIICDRLGIDVWELIRLANRHPRVNILQPGCGVGGHCIAVDPWFIVDQSPDEAKLIRCAREVNDLKPKVVVEKIKKALPESKSDSQVVCFGAAFKPDIDDLRESPALKIIFDLMSSGVKVKLVEPNISKLPDSLGHDMCELVPLEEALGENPEKTVFAVLVAHREFKKSDSLRALNPMDFCGALI